MRMLITMYLTILLKFQPEAYSICVDNVQWLSRTSRFSKDKDNVMHVKCNSFAVKDRVSFEGDDPEARVAAADMPLHTFLPTQEDFDNLKERMIVIVQRILREQAGISTDAPNHIKHKYSDQSCSKSEYVSFFFFFFFFFFFGGV